MARVLLVLLLLGLHQIGVALPKPPVIICGVNCVAVSDTTPDEDFAARASGNGVLFATNWDKQYLGDGSGPGTLSLDPGRTISNYATMVADPAIQEIVNNSRSGSSHAERLSYDTNTKLSGAGSFQFTLYDNDGGNGGGPAYYLNGRDFSTPGEKYVQISVYFPRETLGWVYKGTIGMHKVFNIGRYGGGQVTLFNERFLGFPTLLVNGSESIAALDWDGHSAWGGNVGRLQNAVDRGGPSSSKDDWLRRHGAARGSSVGLNKDMNRSYDGQTFLYERTQPSGFPDTRAAAGGVPYVLDGWTTVEIYTNYQTRRVVMWAAPYGYPPMKVVDHQGHLGTNPSDGGRIELYNGDTDRDGEPGVRPVLTSNYDELITSTQPIPFPGGYTVSLDGTTTPPPPPPNPDPTPDPDPDPQPDPDPEPEPDPVPDPPVGGGSLQDAAEALTAGQSVVFPTDTGLDSADTAWQTGFYPTSTGRWHYMGKPANNGSAWNHRIYNAETNQWSSDQLDISLNKAGHAYGNFTVDEQTGDAYMHFWNYDRVHRYTAATGSWDFTTATESRIGGGQTQPANGLAWHPDLFGPGEGGLVIATRSDLYAWRKSTNSWTRVEGLSYNPDQRKTGCGEYFESENAVLVGSGTSGSLPFYKIVGASSSGGTPTSVNGSSGVGNPPIKCAGVGAGSTAGMLVQHPSDPSRMLLLQKYDSSDSATGNRVWETSDGINWSDTGYRHPFNGGTYAISTAFGAIWAVGNDGSPYSVLWKPND